MSESPLSLNNIDLRNLQSQQNFIVQNYGQGTYDQLKFVQDNVNLGIVEWNWQKPFDENLVNAGGDLIQAYLLKGRLDPTSAATVNGAAEATFSLGDLTELLYKGGKGVYNDAQQQMWDEWNQMDSSQQAEAIKNGEYYPGSKNWADEVDRRAEQQRQQEWEQEQSNPIDPLSNPDPDTPSVTGPSLEDQMKELVGGDSTQNTPQDRPVTDPTSQTESTPSDQPSGSSDPTSEPTGLLNPEVDNDADTQAMANADQEGSGVTDQDVSDADHYASADTASDFELSDPQEDKPADQPGGGVIGGVIGGQTVLLFPEEWGIDEDYEVAVAQALMSTIGQNIGDSWYPTIWNGQVDDGFSDFGSDLTANGLNAVEGYAIAQLDLSALGDFTPIGSMAIRGKEKKKRRTRSNRNPRLQKVA